MYNHVHAMEKVIAHELYSHVTMIIACVVNN